jgi:hypothetical protein
MSELIRGAIKEVLIPVCAMALLASLGCHTAPRTPSSYLAVAQEPVAQGNAILTVAESKRLIAKAVARMPVVRDALQDGMVIVCKGTTNTYVAEELLGRRIPHGAFVIGRVTPHKHARPLPTVEPMAEVILVKGQPRPDLTLDAALTDLKPGDVIIKGANALDYAKRAAAVWLGSPTGGSTGKILPHVGPGKAHLVIPIGLEKQISGRVSEVVEAVNASGEGLEKLPRMQLLPGTIVTELEALRILADVEAFQASAGGIAGAEGAVWLIWRGPRQAVDDATLLVEDVQGEPPFGGRQPDTSGKAGDTDGSGITGSGGL